MKYKLYILLTILCLLTYCKDKEKEESKDPRIKVTFKNTAISLDFFCDPNKETNLEYFEEREPLTEYYTIIKCKLKYNDLDKYYYYHLLVYTPDKSNNEWIKLSEISCLDSVCTISEEPREHVGGEPDAKLVFKVINKDVIKLISSNMRQTGFPDAEGLLIPYAKAQGYFDKSKEIYFFNLRNKNLECGIERINVDISGTTGVTCLPEASPKEENSTSENTEASSEGEVKP
jgi:hypothetical protein